MVASLGALVEPALGHAVIGLLLVVPVVLASLVGGRFPANATAVIAGLSYALQLPPSGHLRIAVAEDAVALLVLLGVGLLVSTLVAGRIEVLTRLEHDRAVLLRAVSHDLRTPLGTIRAAATDLLDDTAGEPDPQVRRHLLHLIDHDAQRLDRLVADILSLSRIETDGMRPHRLPTDLGRLTAAVSRRLDRSTRDVHVGVEVDDDLPLVDVDPAMIEQVLTNLLDNAIRHSPSGGAVDVVVSTSENRGEVTVQVADRGPGVPEEESELIFQPFRSGHLAGSSGVGLAICRAIVLAHDGTISVHQRPGGGAMFEVVIHVD